nr:UPF0280 family protein [Cribrihabitans marinus]
MMRPVCAPLPGGRLHLQHGPIDLILGTDGARAEAFAAARQRFDTLLEELVAELDLLRTAVSCEDATPRGTVARAMHRAAQAHLPLFVTPMAAVAGAVADAILAAMTAAAPLRRAYVNNGGDIALHLAPGETFSLAMAGLDRSDLGRIEVVGGNGIGGIATSGRGGRSLSMGIADSVTVLARDAASADVAATLIANAVDLPDHPGIVRCPADTVQDDSDLGPRPVVRAVPPLGPREIDAALDRGRRAADRMAAAGLIRSAALFLQGRSCQTGPRHMRPDTERSLAHA